jgi:hypothetical protein
VKKVKRLEIEGFRGALATLPLDLTKGGQPVSTVIYGRNGTGKSSVTDAWEWLLTGRIEHLGREGAGPSSYPHFAALPNQSRVLVETTGDSGFIAAQFDPVRITRPRITGDLAALKQLMPHPCHIRFADLAQFVFMTKTERYDMLTQFMGLSRQIDVQKAMRRVQRQFREHSDALEAQRRTVVLRLSEKLGGPSGSFEEVVVRLDPVLRRQSIPTPTSFAELQAADTRLREAVAADPRAAVLARLSEAAALLSKVGSAVNAAESLAQLASTAQPFADLAEELRALALLALLEKGREAVLATGDTHTCPLCGKGYSGDLAAHLSHELEALKALKATHAQSGTALKASRVALQAVGIIPTGFADLASTPPHSALGPRFQAVLAAGNDLQSVVAAQLQSLPKSVEALSAEYLHQAAVNALVIKGAQDRLADAVVSARDATASVVTELQADTTRLQLVADFEIVHAAVETLPQLKRATAAASTAQALVSEFDADVEDYVRGCVEDVQARFDQISEDVAIYFGVLEELTPGLARPSLRVLEDQDRSVVFEVTLHGKLVSPAYKYLSESQLNSFGLAVFLASVRRFNPDFGFVILDDVVNSLDGHKRPQLIKLLKAHFSAHQVLLLTHDSSWRDRIARELPQWKRLHFQRHDPGIGPVLASPPSTIEAVQDLITRDEAKAAGQMLGPLIEDELQDFVEATESELKFNRRNEHTLEPLLVALRKRLDVKLKQQHPAAVAAKALAENVGFRNLCAHAKDPAIDITPQEMQLALDAWLALAGYLRCPIDACSSVLAWDDPAFRCGCGTTLLERLP